jgi:hypothetical protein
MSNYYRDMNDEEKIIHWLETIVGRLDIINDNIVSLIKLNQQAISAKIGTTTVTMPDGVEIEIDECFESNEGFIYHLNWCKGECNI